MGEVLAAEFHSLMRLAERTSRHRGVERALEVVGELGARLAHNEAFAIYLRSERLDALRAITASNGKVQTTAVAATEDFLARVCVEDDYQPHLPLDVLAYTLVRLVEAFLYTQYENEDVALNDDLTNLRAVVSTLLQPRG